jgi:MFS transporter, DHA3 family, macrolide efflux protein
MEQNRAAIQKLIWANAISGFAQGISMIAIPWYMVNTLQQERTFHTIFLFTTLCVLFWGPYAGTLVDRHQRKNIFLVLNAVGFTVLMTAAIVGICYGYVPVEMIVPVFFFTILNYNLHYPALYTFTHEISTQGNFGQVNSLLEIQGQSTNLLSGGAAAVLLSGITYHGKYIIEPVGLQWILLIDGITYAIAFLIIRTIQYTPTVKEQIETGSVWKRLVSGWRYLYGNPHIMIFGMCSYVVFATLIVTGYFVMQVYIDNHLLAGAATLALTEIFYTSGALTSGFLIRKLLNPLGPLRGIQLLMLLTMALLLTIALTKSIVVFLICSLVYGFCNSGIRILRTTWLFERVPNRMMGRAGSAFVNFNIVMRLLFIGIFGFTYFLTHIEKTYLVLAAAVLIALVVLTIGTRERNPKGV